MQSNDIMAVPQRWIVLSNSTVDEINRDLYFETLHVLVKKEILEVAILMFDGNGFMGRADDD